MVVDSGASQDIFQVMVTPRLSAFLHVEFIKKQIQLFQILGISS